MKKLLFLFLLLPFITLAQVTDPAAEELLQQVSARYKAYKSYQVNFTQKLETAAGKKVHEKSGVAIIQGSSFNIDLGEQEILCNGTTLHTYVKKANEVNIQDYEPSEEDPGPDQIFTFYRKGYRYLILAEAKTKKGAVTTVDIQPEDKEKPFYKIRLFINTADKSIKSWVIYQRGSNNRLTFTINKFTPNVATNGGMFTFNKAKYPKVLVTDLRDPK